VISSRQRLRPNWLITIRRYLIAIAFGNLLWETVQMPLYTPRRTGTAAVIAQAVLHCTLGDVLIATAALVAALAVVGSPAWPNGNVVGVAVAVVIIAASYTAYSE
jgi:divalent metal cation (Fe/Co/Zn/Cd) transporter